VSTRARSLILLAVLAALVLPVLVRAQNDERDIALWVLRKGGRVLLDGAAEYTSDPFDLPAGRIHIVGVDTHGTVTDPKALEPLSKLTDLREVFIPARVWSPLARRRP
jgi:hypothetical protein